MGLRIPTNRRKTSWLFTGVVVDLNWRLPRTNPARGQGGTWTRGLRIASQAISPLGHAERPYTPPPPHPPTLRYLPQFEQLRPDDIYAFFIKSVDGNIILTIDPLLYYSFWMLRLHWHLIPYLCYSFWRLNTMVILSYISGWIPLWWQGLFALIRNHQGLLRKSAWEWRFMDATTEVRILVFVRRNN